MKTFWTEQIKLKTTSFPRFMSAPMDGVIDSPMRQLIRKFSPDELLFGEMRHVACVAHEQGKKSVRYNPTEHPLAFQVSANSTEFIDIAVQKIVDHKFMQLNLNSGCPAKNVIKSGSGSALMADPEMLKAVMVALNKEAQGRIPFTVKIRAGFKEKNGFEMAQLAQDCGAEMLIIHPRTQPEGFSGPLDLEMTAKIKKKLTIPVVLSGEINSFADAKKAYEQTGVDGFMVGRALWGAPWKLKEISEAIAGRTFSMSLSEIIKVALEHLALNYEFYGPSGLQPFKSHLARYIKGMPHATTLRRNLLMIQGATLEEGCEKMKAELENLHKFIESQPPAKEALE